MRIPDFDSPMQTPRIFYIQIGRWAPARGDEANWRQVAADGWQVTRGWGEAGALRAHGGALAHAGRCSRLDESKIELAREGRQI